MSEVLRVLFGWIPIIGHYFRPQTPPAQITPPKDFPSAKVAIIGGGIGGCSAAYFLNELCGDAVDIHVFNDDPVAGGRCAVIELEGDTYEAGGAVIHDSNKYLVGFREKFGLTEFSTKTLPSLPLAIFNGQRFVLHLGFSSILNNLKILWNYGWSLIRMNRNVKFEIENFSTIYDMQAKGQSFQTVPDMLRAMGGDTFVQETQVTANNYFKSGLGWNNKLVDDLVCAAMKANYTQDNNIAAFAAFVSLAGMQDSSLWSVVGGNYQLAVKALEASKATYHVANVLSVTRVVSGSTKYTVEYKSLEPSSPEMDFARTTTTSTDFDAVIVAHPLNVSKVAFHNFNKPIYTAAAKTPYHHTIATFIKGDPNPKTFGYSGPSYPRTYPLDILTNDLQNSPVNFCSIGHQIPTTVTVEEAKKYCKPLRDLPTQVFKVFTTVPLTASDKAKLFRSIESETVKEWYAYPHYNPPEQFPPFVLDDGGLLYINCIEKAASALEMSAIGAKNVALLTKEYILQLKKTV